MKAVKFALIGLLIIFVLSLAFPAVAAPEASTLPAPKTCVYLVFFQVDGAGWFGTGITASIVRFPAGEDNICRFSEYVRVLRVRIIGYAALRT